MLALLILIISPLVILRTPTDIFPNIDIPVVSVLWQYSGLNAQEMENRITTSFERNLTIAVNDIEHTESQSWNGDRGSPKFSFLTACQDRGRDSASDCLGAAVHQTDAARHDAAVHCHV